MQKRNKTIALRMVADGAIASTALAIALLFRLWVDIFTKRSLTIEMLHEYLFYWYINAPLLILSVVGTFYLSDIYTKGRFYTFRHKLLRLFQATSIAFGVFVFLLYFIVRPTLSAPRGAFVTAYVLTTLGVLSGRIAKEHVQKSVRRQSDITAGPSDGKRVLVVGGAGYIGSILVRELIAHGYYVRVLDSLAYGDEPLRGLTENPSFDLIRGDFRHVGPVVQAVKGMDAVIHLGAIVGDPACAIDEDETVQTNLAATKLLADVCRGFGVKRILFASTCSVYGTADEIADESSGLNPVSLYAATKIDSERVLLAERGANFHPTVLRLATAFGWSYRPRFDLVVNLLTAKAMAEKKIVIYNGQQWRPFIHVQDIARAFETVLSAPLEVVSGEIFNVGSDYMNYTLQQLAGQIATANSELAVEYIDNSDARDYRVSFHKVKTRLGFECRVGLLDGILEIQKQLESGAVVDYREPRYSNVQLVTRRALQSFEREQMEDQNHTIELTALRFAKNSQSLRIFATSGLG